MQAAYETFGCNQGNVFFIGIDKGNTNASVILFDSTYGIQYPSASGQEGNGNAVHWDYNIQGTPSIVVIKPDRSIAVKQIYPPSTQNVVDSVSMAGGIPQDCITKVEEESARELVLFPNPVVDYLSVSYDSQPILALEKIVIYDLTGRPVDETGILGRTNNKIVLNTQYLPSGFYFIEVKPEGRPAMIRKFIKR